MSRVWPRGYQITILRGGVLKHNPSPPEGHRREPVGSEVFRKNQRKKHQKYVRRSIAGFEIQLEVGDEKEQLIGGNRRKKSGSEGEKRIYSNKECRAINNRLENSAGIPRSRGRMRVDGRGKELADSFKIWNYGPGDLEYGVGGNDHTDLARAVHLLFKSWTV
ncbi:hypothetical protein DFH08DRAFT_825247 [Mycena albidolilacea]|uniref:Uncharacterized protein n=1 Tax=Mycena albidolilacea TaxID=1033008 RepID=A0AAD7E9N5_9AGAR|nr:hypothetical protein DFH08DRAFT_825247 [Mycena albidolilacea]